MKIWEYFTLYYEQLTVFSEDVTCLDPAYQSWVAVERIHKEMTGSSRYNEYRTFRVIKSRFLRSRYITLIKK